MEAVQLQLTLNINDLPQEVLEHIFSFLPINDRKSAGLVCRYWCGLAFSRRVMRRITLRLIDWEHSQQHKYDILQNSSRIYQRILVRSDVPEFQMVLNLLNRFGANLVSFSGTRNFTPDQLRQLVRRTPKIEQLVVALTTSDSPEGELEFPVLKCLKYCCSLPNLLQSRAMNILNVMPNLRDLSVSFTREDDAERSLEVLRMVAPQLKHLEIHSDEYYLNIEDLHFPQLEVLVLSGKVTSTGDDIQQRFFWRFTTLKKVIFEFNQKEFVLDILSERCPLLHTIFLKTEKLGERSLRYLNRLKNVKVLGLDGPLHLNVLIDLAPLPSVETFHLHTYNTNTDNEKAIFLRFAKLLPNVTDLRITLEALSALRENFLSQCRSYTKLRRLHVTDLKIQVDRVVFHPMPPMVDLGSLEELSLNSIDICFLVPSDTLKRLKLQYVPKMENGDMMAIVERYPNLRYLEVGWCRSVTTDGIRAVRTVLPECIVHHLP